MAPAAAGGRQLWRRRLLGKALNNPWVFPATSGLQKMLTHVVSRSPPPPRPAAEPPRHADATTRWVALQKGVTGERSVNQRRDERPAAWRSRPAKPSAQTPSMALRRGRTMLSIRPYSWASEVSK